MQGAASISKSSCCSCDSLPEYISHLKGIKRFYDTKGPSPFYSHVNVSELLMLDPFKNEKQERQNSLTGTSIP